MIDTTPMYAKLWGILACSPLTRAERLSQDAALDLLRKPGHLTKPAATSSSSPAAR